MLSNWKEIYKLLFVAGAFLGLARPAIRTPAESTYTPLARALRVTRMYADRSDKNIFLNGHRGDILATIRLHERHAPGLFPATFTR